MSPPKQLHLRYCPHCGRDDRRQTLPQRHQYPDKGATRCPGTVVTLLYRLAPT